MWLEGFLDVELLGQGGAGDVYRARRASTGAPVAIKFLRPSTSEDLTIERELQALVGLQGHPNVVHVEEVIRLDEHLGLVMEYAPGGSVADLMRARGGNLTAAETILIGAQTASALGEAHAHGFIHRDIKPHNLLIGKFGQVKVCDFGIAALAARDELHTVPDALTPRYASPEELRNDPDITVRTDVYSLASTLHHVLTGQHLVLPTDPSVTVLDWWRPGDLDPVVAEGLRITIRGAAAADPDLRPDARVLADEFDRLAYALGDKRARRLDPETDTTVARRSPSASPISHARSLGTTDSSRRTPVPDRNPRRSRWPWVAIGLTLVAAAIAGGVIMFAVGGTDDAQTAQEDPTTDGAAERDDVAEARIAEPTADTRTTTNDAGSQNPPGNAAASIEALATTTLATPTTTVAPSTTTTSTTSTTTSTSTTTIQPDPEAEAHLQVNMWLEGDRTTLGTLAGSFVPQLSAKVYGLRTDPATESRVAAGGVLWDWQAIADQHQEARDRFGAVLASYLDLGEGEQDLVDWVFTLVPIRHGDAEDVQRWCESNGFAYPTACIAQEVPG